MYQPFLRWQLIIVMLLLVGCAGSREPRTLTTGSFQSITGRDLRIVTGQIVYVPAYSESFLWT